MNPTLHIIRKDLRFNRWALVLWLAAIITHFTLRCIQIQDPSWGGSALATSSRWDHLLLFALPLIIIPFIMQADAVRKRHAFWQSLPISKTRLLFAKAITLISVFILLPMAFEITYYFLAGLESVLWNSLKIWLFLHVPLVLIAYFLCYLTPGWKSYFCMMLPLAAVGTYVNYANITATPLSALKPHPNSVNIYKSIAAPEDTTLQIVENSGKMNHIYNRMPLDKFPDQHVLYSTIRPSAQVNLKDLPHDIAIVSLDAYVKTKIGEKYHDANYTLSIVKGESTNYIQSNQPTESERAIRRSIIGKRQMNHSFLLSLKPSNSIDIAYEDIPEEGVTLTGKVQVKIAKKIVLSESPYFDGTIWKQGLHSIKMQNLGNSPWPDLSTSSISLVSTTSDDYLQDPNCSYLPNGELYISIAHKNLPLESTVKHYKRADFYVYNRGSKDVSRHRNHAYSNIQVASFSNNDNRLGPLALLRFKDEENKMSDWSIRVVTYEPLGTVEFPFFIKIDKPYSELVPNVKADELAPQPASKIERLKQLSLENDVKFLSDMAGILNDANDSEIVKNENFIYPALKKIFAANAETLIKALKQEADKTIFDIGQSGDDYTQYQTTNYTTGLQSWREYDPKLKPFWQRVNRFLTTAVKNEHKLLILENLHPIVNQHDLLERMGWDQEAAPILAKMFQNQRMPQFWTYIFERYPSQDSYKALIKQIQLGSRSLSRTIQFINNISNKKLRKEAASEFWERLVRQSEPETYLRLTLLMALKNGVEVAPRDVSRLIETTGWTAYYEQAQVDRMWLSVLQILALYSDCPTELNEGKKWMVLHGKDLRWDETLQRYAIGSNASTRNSPFEKDVWGDKVDPIGVGKFELQAETNEMRLTTSAHEADYTSDFLYRYSPRLMREVTGDFTAEVTILPEFAASPSWTGDPNKIFQAAGLVLEAGQTSHLRIERTMQGPDQAQHIRERISRASKETNYDTKENPSFIPSKPITFRISRHGTEVFAAWKQEDGPWHESRAHRVVQWWQTVKIGIYVSNYCVKPFSAIFKDYRITTDSKPPLSSGTAALPKVSDSIVHDAEISRWGRLHNILNGGVVRADDQKLLMRVAPSINDFNFQQIVGAPRTVNSVKGDFEQEVELDPISLEKWSGAALYLQNGYTSMFRFGPAMDKKPYFDIHSSGYNYNFYVPPHHFAVDFTKTMRLRIRRVGHLFYAGIKQEGDWQEMAPFYLKCPEEISVGVVGMNTSQKEVQFTFRDYTLKTQP